MPRKVSRSASRSSAPVQKESGVQVEHGHKPQHSSTARIDRRILFVSGTRAEFGLMGSVLHAIQNTPGLHLQILLTGMHLDRSRGRSIDFVRRDGWRVDHVVPWKAGDNSPIAVARNTGKAIVAMASAFDKLKPDVVLVVGDRVEAFAAASAAHIAGIVVAQVHGGDRALGLVDDSLRHAITKLSHLHFPATVQSAERIAKLGEDRFRIKRAGAPGIDGIALAAASRADLRSAFPGVEPGKFALLLLHPSNPDESDQAHIARTLLDATEQSWPNVIVVYPNNDPGSSAIAAVWDELGDRRAGVRFCRDLPRTMFLGLMRDAAALVGNSSAGIIEAASFGTPVLDVGSRQRGRERSGNVVHIDDLDQLSAAIQRINRTGRWRGQNVYGQTGGGERIAKVLASIELKTLRQKLIAY